jgi:hypothetical protein
MVEKPPPTIWFIARSVTDIYEMNGFISTLIETKKPRTSNTLEKLIVANDFNNVKPDDIVVLYIPSEGLIVDIANVKPTAPQQRTVYSPPKKVLVREVESLNLLKGKHLNFRQLVEDSVGNPFPNFPDTATLDDSGNPKLQRKRYVKLTNDEYVRIKKALNNPVYLINLDINPVMHRIGNSEHLSALLDFYNTRTTSFANLFVATIFGLAAISAIVQTNPIFAMLLLIPFIVVSFAACYLILSYCYYADIAERIKSSALVYANFEDLNRPKVCFQRKGRYTYCGLIDYIQTKRRISFDVKLPLILCVITLICLFIAVYWNPFGFGAFFSA